MQERYTFQIMAEGQTFDPTVLYELAPFTQAGFYGDWQRSLGRRVINFLVVEKATPVAAGQLIKFPLVLGKSYLYAPYGPVARSWTRELLTFLREQLAALAREEAAVFCRLDFSPPAATPLLEKLFTRAPRASYHSSYFQPRTEWFLPLKPAKEQLLRQMKKNIRYSIGLAAKKGIEVEVVAQDFGRYFADFYQLMRETAARDNFSLHDRKYYEQIFASLPALKNSYLVVAKLGQKILVINLVVVFGGVANHIFGGSSSEERWRQPSPLAQWHGILEAKRRGAAFYNFGGISSDPKTNQDWRGLTFFKQRFGGEKVTHSNFYDIVVQPFWYHLYNLRKVFK